MLWSVKRRYRQTPSSGPMVKNVQLFLLYFFLWSAKMKGPHGKKAVNCPATILLHEHAIIARACHHYTCMPSLYVHAIIARACHHCTSMPSLHVHAIIAPACHHCTSMPSLHQHAIIAPACHHCTCTPSFLRKLRHFFTRKVCSKNRY